MDPFHQTHPVNFPWREPLYPNEKTFVPEINNILVLVVSSTPHQAHIRRMKNARAGIKQTRNKHPKQSASNKQNVQALIKTAKLMRESENVKQALVQLSKAKEMNVEIGDQLSEALILEEFSFCYDDIGCYEKAIKMAHDAIEIYKQVSFNLGIANCLTFIGGVCSKLGKSDEAIGKLEEAIDIYLKLGEDRGLGIAYGNFGKVYNDIGKHKRALDLSKEGLRISEKTGDKFEKATNLHNMGNAYHSLRNFKESIKCLAESAAIWKEMGRKQPMSISYGALAYIFTTLTQFDKAEYYYDLCININRENKQFVELGKVYGNKARMYYFMAFAKFIQFDDAKESFQSCIQTYKLAIQSTDKMLSNLAFDSNMTAVSDKYYRWYDLLTAPFILLGRSSAALLLLDLGRAKILRHLVYKEVIGSKEDEDHSTSSSSWSTFENGKEKERMSFLCKEIQLLESNATVLFYNFNMNNVFTIWLLDASGCVSLKTSDPGELYCTALEELDNNITELLDKASVGYPRDYSFYKQSSQCAQPKNLANRENNETASNVDENGKVSESQRDYRSPAKQRVDTFNDLAADTRSNLYRILIAPVKSLIKGTKLIIVPQRCLFFAPFSSLIDDNRRLLSEEYQIQIIPSVHVLERSMQLSRSKKIGISLFVGNPEVSNLPSLLSAAEEAEYLASLLHAKPVIGCQATKSNVLSLMSQASILHIAAHGHENDGHIFLAPAKTNENSSSTSNFDLLTQSDVLECKLVARFVVLSCCQSGKGNISTEGVLGIARSFLGAGASSVLVTLWNISDTFTKQFMKVFYEKILQEKSVCLALKETKNLFQRSGGCTSFLYWAPFEIIGEDVQFSKTEVEEIMSVNKKFFTI